MNKKLFAVILFLMVFVMGIKVPLITKAEDAKKENSWRYENGQLIQKKKQNVILLLNLLRWKVLA